MMIVCAAVIFSRLHIVVDSLLNDGMTSNKVNQISSYGPLTQKLMAVSKSLFLFLTHLFNSLDFSG